MALNKLEYQANATVLPSTTEVARLRLMIIADEAVVIDDRRPNKIPKAFSIDVGFDVVVFTGAIDGVVL